MNVSSRATHGKGDVVLVYITLEAMGFFMGHHLSTESIGKTKEQV